MTALSSLSERDRRALLLLGIAVAAFLVLQFGVFPRSEGAERSSAPVELLERRLRRLQAVAAQKPWVAAEAEAAARELAEAEKGLLKAATSAQASAVMLQVLRDLLRDQGIGLQSSEFGPVRPAGQDYAQVPLTVNFTCAIEQWINLMTALRNAPQLLSTQEVRITQGDLKNKMINVRMVVAGYIPASVAAAAKGQGALL